jgi:hypothetical protein
MNSYCQSLIKQSISLPTYNSILNGDIVYSFIHNKFNSQHPKTLCVCVWGGGTRGDWLSQVGTLSQLLVLTVGRVVLVSHRVMQWSALYLQCTFTAQCATFQLPASAGLGWASSQYGMCRLSASGRQCVSTAQIILRWLCALCLRCICTALVSFTFIFVVSCFCWRHSK